jgi:hypothetical protein
MVVQLERLIGKAVAAAKLAAPEGARKALLGQARALVWLTLRLQGAVDHD